jgi:hypothetical protein
LNLTAVPISSCLHPNKRARNIEKISPGMVMIAVPIKAQLEFAGCKKIKTVSLSSYRSLSASMKAQSDLLRAKNDYGLPKEVTQFRMSGP